MSSVRDAIHTALARKKIPAPQPNSIRDLANTLDMGAPVSVKDLLDRLDGLMSGDITARHVIGGGEENGVSGFSDQIQLSLKLPPGLYVLRARIQLGNIDEDEQNSSCGLRIRSSSVFIDRLDFSLLGRGSLAGRSGAYIALQGVCALSGSRDTIDLTAGTFNGFARNASIIALAVDVLIPPIS